jgi:spore coat polysaccharide biosynthesis predicted glycosyltransferase SpsG/L-amino acid N-acyltransferase YncA
VRILIHCNGGPRIGVGHVLRSVALAEQAESMGHEVTLVGVLEGELVRRQLAGVASLVVDAASLSVADAVVERTVAELRPTVVHVDSYDTGKLSDGGAHLLSQTEDGDFGRRSADVVIDPTFGAEWDPRDADRSGLLLRGSRYAALRKQVTRRQGQWQLREKARRVLVVMGGTDPQGLTPRVLDLLGRTGRQLEVTALVGSSAWERCESVVAAYPALSVRLLPPVDDLPGGMVEADLVLSAAGTSVGELCCLGVPMALVRAVDNQRLGYDRVVAAGAAAGLGGRDDLEGERATEVLRAVLGNSAIRGQLSARASSVVDGLGAWRVVSAWQQQVEHEWAPTGPVDSSMSVRDATLADARLLLDWRNDPATRAASRASAEVTVAEHAAWLESSLAREDRLLLVAEDGAGPVGTVRWDRRAEREWEVSITVAPARRGLGLARPLLEAGERGLSTRTGSAVWALASVHASNDASHRLFTGSSYVPEAPADVDGFEQYAKLRPGPR